MNNLPSVDESYERLHRAGWSVGEIATASEWIVSGGDAVVVVRIRGARGSGVRGAAVRAGLPRSLERWNCMTPSLCETCAWMREMERAVAQVG